MQQLAVDDYTVPYKLFIDFIASCCLYPACVKNIYMYQFIGTPLLNARITHTDLGWNVMKTMEESYHSSIKSLV